MNTPKDLGKQGDVGLHVSLLITVAYVSAFVMNNGPMALKRNLPYSIPFITLRVHSKSGKDSLGVECR